MSPDTPSLPPISEAESRMMQKLWREHSAVPEQLAMSLMPEHGWQLSTIATPAEPPAAKGAIDEKRRPALPLPPVGGRGGLAEIAEPLAD